CQNGGRLAAQARIRFPDEELVVEYCVAADCRSWMANLRTAFQFRNPQSTIRNRLIASPTGGWSHWAARPRPGLRQSPRARVPTVPYRAPGGEVVDVTEMDQKDRLRPVRCD